MDRHPIFCILPPQMLKNISEKGSDQQRELALNTLRVSEQFRAQRQGLAAVPSSNISAGPALKTLKRTVYSAKFGSKLPGVVVRKEGGPPSSEPAVNEAYDGSGATYNLYKNVYGRLSVDDKGLPLNSTVHYQKNYDNAFWNGQQMVYGDGDENLPPAQRLFNRFTISVDVIGHELTHGVTQFEASLVYWDQPGALNESFSDVFGSLVKQYQLRQTAAQADWLIGQGLLTANVKGVALRSMKAPGTAYNDPVLGKDDQPAHMKNYVNTSQDSGGVHTNSGIPNHAFYVTAVEMGGFAWEKAGLVWYLTLRDKLTDRATFADCAKLTYQVAGVQFGKGSFEQKAVQKGWAEVGIKVGTTSPKKTPPKK
jgi:Zn-dependent metalloprotease